MKIPQTFFELQSGHDFVTDRQTGGRMDRRTDDKGKNNMSPNPTWGDIINAMTVHDSCLSLSSTEWLSRKTDVISNCIKHFVNWSADLTVSHLLL